MTLYLLIKVIWIVWYVAGTIIWFSAIRKLRKDDYKIGFLEGVHSWLMIASCSFGWLYLNWKWDKEHEHEMERLQNLLLKNYAKRADRIENDEWKSWTPWRREQFLHSFNFKYKIEMKPAFFENARLYIDNCEAESKRLSNLSWSELPNDVQNHFLRMIAPSPFLKNTGSGN